MSLRSIISFILGCLCLSAAAAPSPVSLADTLYMRGDYKQSAEAYLAIAQVDGESPELLFNLANSYAQAGDYGNAIL